MREFERRCPRIIWVLAWVYFLSGCSAQRALWHQDQLYPEKSGVRGEPSGLGQGINAPIIQTDADGVAPLQPPEPARPRSGDMRMVIYDGALMLAVADVERAIESAIRTTQEMGGHVQRRTDQSVTLRVPATRFDAAIAAFEGLGTVAAREVEGSDVTEEYVDLEARIRAAEVVRDRLVQLLAKADKVEDALAVERELARINSELESLRGKLELIKNRIALSTIVLNFERVARRHDRLQPTVRLPFAWLDQLDLGRLMGEPDLKPSTWSKMP